jgi:hypothetical protein
MLDLPNSQKHMHYMFVPSLRSPNDPVGKIYCVSLSLSIILLLFSLKYYNYLHEKILNFNSSLVKWRTCENEYYVF